MFLFPLICSCLIFSISNAQSSYPPNNLTASERGTLVDNKIIFFDSADFQLTHAFSLDLSVSWNISAPAFTNLEDLRAPTFRYTAFSAFKRDSRTLIYAFGGLNPSKDDDWSQGTFIDDFYEIDITSHPILISKLPITSEGTPGARCFFTSVFDDKGKLYIWGGETRATTDKAMYIFDTSKSKWSRVFPSSAPEQRSGYSVTFKDNKLYFIGGIFANKPDQKCVDIREILIYDTLDTNNPWTTQSATNNTYISDRYVHSAILAPDKQAIILYGGSLSGYSGVPRDYLLALDLQTFKFSVPVTQNEPKIDDVSDHPTAVLYNNYMIVCLGYFRTVNTNRKVIKVLDLQREYTWVEKFVANPSISISPPGSDNSPPENNDNYRKTLIIVSSTLGSIIVVLLAGFIVYFIRTRKKRRANDAFPPAVHENLAEINPTYRNQNI